MADLGQTLIEMHRQRLENLAGRAAAAIGQLSQADLHWRPNAESNSIANLVLHMAGNLRQHMESGVGGLPDTRDRDTEFNSREPLSKAQLLAVLAQSYAAADAVLASLSPGRLTDTLVVRDKPTTVLDELFGTAVHLSEHVGQILYVAKLRLGPEYSTLSIRHKRA